MKTEDLLAEAKEFFEYLKKDIAKFAKKDVKSVAVSFQEIASFSHELAEHLLKSPEEMLLIFELALNEMGLITNPELRITDLSESQKIKIKDIRAKTLGQLTYIDVILIGKGEVLPSYSVAKFECPSCGTIISVLQESRKIREPSRCGCGRINGFRRVSIGVVDTIKINCRDLRENEKQKIDTRLIDILSDELVSDIDEIPVGSMIRLIGTPILQEINIQGKNIASYSFKVNNVQLLKKAEELETSLIKNEAQLRDFLYRYPYYIEDGLMQVDIEKRFDNIQNEEGDLKSGRADLIFQDSIGRPLIIELKIEAHSKDADQILKYVKAFLKENPMTEHLVRKMIGCLTASNNLSKICKEKGIELKIFDRIKITTKKDNLIDIPLNIKSPFRKPSDQAFFNSEIDINKISTDTINTKRGKIILVSETIKKLETSVGKLIPVDLIIKELFNKIEEEEVIEVIEELINIGDIFIPKKGYIQFM